ncbi:hypothetical protein [Streptomyces sp.]|uniref:hypothetical protein n=1 Tax=Streptomyces sp. TaxID=1931 RepID=UPI0028110677|nr:hypothetical protein [Streptomyces sp.]
MTDARSPLRALRAALFAVVCVALSAVGHSSMSAHPLPPLALLAAFAVTTGAAWAAAGRRRGPVTIAGALLVLQGALHLTFSAAGGHAPAPAATPAAHAGHALGHGHGAHTTMDMAHTVPGAAPGPGAGMLAAHLLAALLCGLWLARGEAALFTLARAALAYAFTPLRLPLALVPVPDAPRGPVRRTRRDAPEPHSVLLAHALSRRGPPRPPAPRATALGARTAHV